MYALNVQSWEDKIDQRPRQDLNRYETEVRNPMSRRLRYSLALIVAPLAPLLMTLWPQLAGRANIDLSGPRSGRVLILILLASYGLSVLAGIPAYFVVRRFRRQGWWLYLAGAFAAGAASVPLGILGLLLWGLAVAGPQKFEAAAHLFADAIGQVVGASIGIGMLFSPVGLLFWFVAKPGGARRQ